MRITRRRFSGAAVALLVRGAANGAQAAEQELHLLANRERQSRLLPALSWNNVLAAEARRHSERMARLEFFDHRDPQRGGLPDRLEEAGIEYQACAENLYRQSRAAGAAAAAVRAWLNSRGHRSNLLSRTYRYTGIGIAGNRAGHTVITQLFVA